MKNKIMRISIVCVAAILLFGLSGCPSPVDESKGTGALLTGISIGVKDTDTVEVDIKDPISFSEYTPGMQFTNEQTGIIHLQNEAALAKAVTLTVSSKAKALVVRGSDRNGNAVTGGNHAISDETIATDGVKHGEVIENLRSGNHIVVKVTSEDQKIDNYYVFRVEVLGHTSTLNRFTYTVKGENAPSTAVPIVISDPDTGTPDAVSWANVKLVGSIGLSSATHEGVFDARGSDTLERVITKEYAIGTGTTVPPTADFKKFTTTALIPEQVFVDNQRIYIRVTSENGESVSLYIFEIHAGRDANLESVTFSVTGNRQPAEATLGVPNADASKITEVGIFEPGLPQPATGFAFTAKTRDPEATFKWAKGSGTTVPTSFGETSPITFVAGDFLYVEVSAKNPAYKLYYKIEVTLGREVTLFYGQPKIRDASNRFYVDPMWNDAKHALLDVSRINLAEQAGSFGFLNPADASKSGHTTATAKAMWDDEGLYVYINVDVWPYYNTAADKAAEPPVVTQRAIAVGTDHNCDNVEIFTNERLQSRASGNFGSQYRVGPPATADQATNHGNISGDSSATGAIDLFNNSNNYSAWIRLDGTRQIGYTVVAKVPWVYVSHAEANQVFDANGLIMASDTNVNAGPTIGMELQLNTATTAGSRDAILTWNGVRSQAYQNVGSFGRATLVLGAGANRVLPEVKPPTINTQPHDRTYSLVQLGDSTYTQSLSVAATSSGGTLSYQWYKAANATEVTTENPAELITGATAASYKPAATTPAGLHYYYVVVTNTRTIGANVGTAKIISRTATVTVTDTVADPIATNLTNVGQFGTGGGHTLTEDGDGFVINRTATGWSDAYYLRFQFELARNLADFEKVTFKYTPISGDTNYKDLRLSIDTTDFTGGIGNDSARVAGRLATGGINDGTTYDYEITISNDKKTAVGTNRELRFAFNMGTTAISYRITDIVLVATTGSNVNIYFTPRTGTDPGTGLELGDATDWNHLLGSKRSVTRTGRDVVYGNTMESLITGGNFSAIGQAKVRRGDDNFVYATQTIGSGANAFTLLKPGAITFDDPKAMYRLEFAGRLSVFGTTQSPIPNGRLEFHEIDGAVINANGVSGISATGFDMTITLTASNVQRGLMLYANQWGNNAGDESSIIFSIDDLVVFKEPAPVISNFAIVMTAPVAGAAAPTHIDATQFTGTVTWAPAPVDGNFVLGTAYTATIVIAAKAGFQAEDLTNAAAFTINGTARASYNAATKTIVSTQFPAAIQPPPAVTVNFSDITVTASGGSVSEKNANGFVWQIGGYGQYVKFPVTIANGFNLGDYTSVIVNIASISGDITYKAVVLLGGTTVIADNNTIGTSNPQFSTHTATGRDMTITLDKARTATLSGAIELGIHINAAGTGSQGGAGSPTSYRFTNVRLVP